MIEKVIVVGLGEVGRPLLQLISEHHHAIGIDVAPTSLVPGIDVMHVCYPFQISDFVGTTLHYIELYEPKLTIINSTVAAGTTRTIAQRSSGSVVFSPVRGKHEQMPHDLRRYVKFIGALDDAAAHRAAAHFESIGITPKIFSTPETAELAKLTETTYFGLLIAWAQDIERMCDQLGIKYAEVASFFDEIGFLPPVRYFPGIIGGHCVMPNIELLRKTFDSGLLKAICDSNEKKAERGRKRLLQIL
jgi:UDP-N-acetyl-D-mannosaminuronate dehydrogenase